MPSPKVVAVIPARGGSKGIPHKNLQEVGGFSLVARAVRNAKATDLIDQVFVTTDDDAIRSEAERFGAEVVLRPPELANDTATSEAALLHAIQELNSRGVDPEVVVFIQATSPFIDSRDLDAAIARVLSKEADVCFSAFQTFAFLWEVEDGRAVGVNHDHSYRPRRQDRKPHFQETGAFYVMRKSGFVEAGYRFFGKVAIQEVKEDSALEIDDAGQLETARALAHLFQPVTPPPGSIKALVMDFDGVHTDDTARVDAKGIESVTVSRSDGMGLERLKKAGLPMLILSKETNGVVTARAQKLGIEVSQGVQDKLPKLKAWCLENEIELSNVCYLGNDLNDLACLDAVGWPATPKDANPIAISRALIVSSKNGGKGAVREVCEIILAQMPDNEGRGPR